MKMVFQVVEMLQGANIRYPDMQAFIVDIKLLSITGVIGSQGFTAEVLLHTSNITPFNFLGPEAQIVIIILTTYIPNKF